MIPYLHLGLHRFRTPSLQRHEDQYHRESVRKLLHQNIEIIANTTTIQALIIKHDHGNPLGFRIAKDRMEILGKLQTGLFPQ